MNPRQLAYQTSALPAELRHIINSDHSRPTSLLKNISWYINLRLPLLVNLIRHSLVRRYRYRSFSCRVGGFSSTYWSANTVPLFELSKRLELLTSCLQGKPSTIEITQHEPQERIELLSAEYETAVFPLYYRGMGGRTGIEPAITGATTRGFTTKLPTSLSIACGVRTHDLLLEGETT